MYKKQPCIREDPVVGVGGRIAGLKPKLESNSFNRSTLDCYQHMYELVFRGITKLLVGEELKGEGDGNNSRYNQWPRAIISGSKFGDFRWNTANFIVIRYYWEKYWRSRYRKRVSVAIRTFFISRTESHHCSAEIRWFLLEQTFFANFLVLERY